MIGTFAALAWPIASSVWGMTPSSAATTTTAMSVTFAPRARIAVNASWPGVSRNTTRRSPRVTSLAPMCWVMPPRSPAATVVERMASRRLVLPWSTWPMTVTIGARSTRSAASSSVNSSSLVAACGRLHAVLADGGDARRPAAPRPRSRARSATSDAVSRSMSWLIVAKMPLLISSRMTSAGLTPSSSASSLTVIVAGSSTAPRIARIDDLDRGRRRMRRRDAGACGVRAGRGCRSYYVPSVPPPLAAVIELVREVRGDGRSRARDRARRGSVAPAMQPSSRQT